MKRPLWGDTLAMAAFAAVVLGFPLCVWAAILHWCASWAQADLADASESVDLGRAGSSGWRGWPWLLHSGAVASLAVALLLIRKHRDGRLPNEPQEAASRDQSNRES